MSSKKPRKQRKLLYQAPLHKRKKFLASRLSKELTKQLKRRSLTLRKGDEVKIVRGKFKKTIGKITKINLKKSKVYIEGVKRKKISGQEVQVPIHPSNLIILSADLTDPKRQKAIKRKSL